jgi:hypothetical protein
VPREKKVVALVTTKLCVNGASVAVMIGAKRGKRDAAGWSDVMSRAACHQGHCSMD